MNTNLLSNYEGLVGQFRDDIVKCTYTYFPLKKNNDKRKVCKSGNECRFNLQIL